MKIRACKPGASQEELLRNSRVSDLVEVACEGLDCFGSVLNYVENLEQMERGVSGLTYDQVNELQSLATENAGKIAALGWLLQCANTEAVTEFRDPRRIDELLYRVGAILEDYAGFISDSCSELEFLARGKEEGPKLAE